MLGKKRELTQQGADSIEKATGATIKQVGDELLRSIPNVSIQDHRTKVDNLQLACKQGLD